LEKDHNLTQVIAPLAAGDTDDAVALWHASGLARPWNDAQADFVRALNGATSVVLGRRDGSRLVARVVVGDDGHRGWVYYLAVDAALRGRGHGTAMMAAAESWLRDRGCTKLNLMVRSDNAGALGFYQHLGYVRDDIAVLAQTLG
jgi:ribosomal protein S18 acetylase RimI-like enzyme